MQHVIFIKNKVANIHSYTRHTRTKPIASILIMAGGRFPKILDFFQGLKIGVPSGRLEETSIFKIMIDDVTLWSKLKSTW